MLDALAHFELSMGPMVMAARPPVGKDIRELAPNPKDLERNGTPRGFQAAQVQPCCHIDHTRTYAAWSARKGSWSRPEPCLEDPNPNSGRPNPITLTLTPLVLAAA